MTTELLQLSVLLCLAVLLPVVPAYVLYRTLPASAQVSGPFKGLNIQLTGAFAGYFLILLVVVALITQHPVPARYQVWSVSGKVLLHNGDSTEQVAHADFSVQPPTTLLFPDGRFDLDVPVKQGQGDTLEFPVLIVSHPGYLAQTVALSERQPSFGALSYTMHADERSKKWVIDSPIVLQPVGARSPP